MNSFDKLTKLFSDFPGIGPRQAKRFVYFLLTRNPSYIDEFITLIKSIKADSALCSSCFRYFISNKSPSTLCPICNDRNRDLTKLMIVARDVDMENMEKTGVYDGYYFVLGGTVPILEKEPERLVRIKELEKRLAKEADLKEIIIAMNANPEGENTEDFLRLRIKEISGAKNINLSTLGRGLSTGIELEYSDSDTLKSALKNREHTS
ncbi:MAG: hypothetical protein A3E93_01315 [Candidatus Zambryskibacteria bacterium RIFCSPHIGHO2_12_FULL_43_12b]|uniref:Recombination protein RecR n=1 Tax=Candidatus Zambryskibacteria bacterium RIFCSPLOWO2_01_FULL_43_17 TaxID=1802760 RepID=A0A1G2U1U5_9BACT|nr:MAG: hypothetical protein A3E93_01315 [Candidatus Zambryskibacteria bacterium RIFCSPHIGHO2_12_FULL_43_12b]OHB03477.1 MAG: hypothetical protein A2920_02275 [Candidatus Zambryskibacteria bacterium RIFCSPLOWO2_01_FULL_43_17]